MKASKFLGNYLKVDSLASGPVDVTIRTAKEETLGFGNQAKKKIVLYFAEIEQGLALNATNTRRLTKGFGSEETDDWIGKRIRLTIEEVQGPNGITDGIVARVIT